MKSLKLRRIISNTIIYIILIAMSIVWLLPIAWLVLQSFGDGYVIDGGKLSRDRFAIATYEDPVKNYPLNRVKENKVTV